MLGLTWRRADLTSQTMVDDGAVSVGHPVWHANDALHSLVITGVSGTHGLFCNGKFTRMATVDGSGFPRFRHDVDDDSFLFRSKVSGKWYVSGFDDMEASADLGFIATTHTFELPLGDEWNNEVAVDATWLETKALTQQSDGSMSHSDIITAGDAVWLDTGTGDPSVNKASAAARVAAVMAQAEAAAQDSLEQQTYLMVAMSMQAEMAPLPLSSISPSSLLQQAAAAPVGSQAQKEFLRLALDGFAPPNDGVLGELPSASAAATTAAAGSSAGSHASSVRAYAAAKAKLKPARQEKLAAAEEAVRCAASGPALAKSKARVEKLQKEFDMGACAAAALPGLMASSPAGKYACAPDGAAAQLATYTAAIETAHSRGELEPIPSIAV